MVLRNGSNLSSDWSEMNGTGAEDGASSQAIRVDELDHFDEAWVKPFPLRDGVRIRKGERFSDYYTLFEEIGEGKFGKVYRCVEKATNLMLAAKCIKIRKDTDFEKVEKEVNIMTQMRHKCIAQIYDAFATTDNDVILIMEIVQGGELFDRVADDSYILTEMAVALIMFQICEAIRYIHSQNIIHLDLKPENIMCISQTSNQIKLIDFGLAQWYDGSKDLMFMAGTPEFAAPEVIKYEPLDFHTDMWSLGVIAYILLSGQSPFLGETLAHTYCNVERGNWMFCEEFAENGISSDAKDFISKLLILDKDRRMLPEQCLRHPWIRKNRERALLASRTASPAVCHPLAVDKLRKYVKNKRFRRLVFGVLFINQVMRMMQTMQRNKSVHGVEYVRNLLVAAEERRADANKSDEKHGIGFIGGIAQGGPPAVPKHAKQEEEEADGMIRMDTTTSSSDHDHHPNQQRKQKKQQWQMVVAVTPIREEGRRGDTNDNDGTVRTAATDTEKTAAASSRKKVVVVKRVAHGGDDQPQQQQPAGEKKKRSKSEARRAADPQRSRSSTEQTSNKKQRQQQTEASAVEQHHHQHQQRDDASSAKSPLMMARRLEGTLTTKTTTTKSPLLARRSHEPPHSGTGDSAMSPLVARRSAAAAVEKTVKFEEMMPMPSTTTAVPKIEVACIPSPTLKKRVGAGDTNVLKIAARLIEEHSCSPCTSSSSAATSTGKRLSAEATAAPKKTVPSLSTSNVSALLKKLEQKGAETAAATATRSATRSATTATRSVTVGSALPLAVTAIGPLKKGEEQKEGEKKQQQQKKIKLVKKKKKVLRVRTADEETEQRQKRLLDETATAPSTAMEEKPGMKQQQKQRRSDKAQLNADQALEEKPMLKLNGQREEQRRMAPAQNGHGAEMKPREKQLNGATTMAEKQLTIGLMSPRAKQRLIMTNSVPLAHNGRRAGNFGGESVDEMDEGGWGVVGQDVFDFSLLRKKLQNRIMGLKDKEDLETEAENQQRFELQKQQNMLRTNLNIKRAMRKWISMDKETKLHQQHNYNNGSMFSRGEAQEMIPDWAR